jgi:hypothetical protein
VPSRLELIEARADSDSTAFARPATADSWILRDKCAATDKTGQVPLREFITTPAPTACERPLCFQWPRTIALQLGLEPKA